MEFVRLKYANNKLFNANLKEHNEVIEEYVLKRGYEYLGFVPVVFGPSGKMVEIDLVFRKAQTEKPLNNVTKTTDGAEKTKTA